MNQAAQTKKLFINKYLQINSTLFNSKRLIKGLSILQLALNVNMAAETVRRALTVGSDPRPSTIKRLGEYLGIPPDEWYVPREHPPNERTDNVLS